MARYVGDAEIVRNVEKDSVDVAHLRRACFAQGATARNKTIVPKVGLRHLVFGFRFRAYHRCCVSLRTRLIEKTASCPKLGPDRANHQH